MGECLNRRPGIADDLRIGQANDFLSTFSCRGPGASQVPGLGRGMLVSP